MDGVTDSLREHHSNDNGADAQSIEIAGKRGV